MGLRTPSMGVHGAGSMKDEPTFAEIEAWLADAIANAKDDRAGLAVQQLLAILIEEPEQAARAVLRGDLDDLVREAVERANLARRDFHVSG